MDDFESFYTPILQCLKGIHSELFPKASKEFIELGYSLKHVNYLKIFQESYYERFVINCMMNSLQGFSKDACQLSLIQEIRQSLLLVDSALDEVNQGVVKQDKRNCDRSTPSEDVAPSNSFLSSQWKDQKKNDFSYAVFLYKETSLSRSMIHWIFLLIAPKELQDLPLYELPENQDLVQILSKYDDEMTWVNYFPKSIDLFTIICQQYYASEKTISRAAYQPIRSFYQRPFLPSQQSSYLHADYFRTVLYFRFCQALVTSVMQSTILSLTKNILTQTEELIFQEYQDMIQFFLKYSLQDLFRNDHSQRREGHGMSRSSSPNSSASTSCSQLKVLNDIGLSLNLFIYSIVMKLLLISRPTQLSDVAKGKNQTISNLSFDYEYIQEHLSDLVAHLFTSMNSFDYLSNPAINQLDRDSRIQSGYSLETMANGIRMLLSLGQSSAILNRSKNMTAANFHDVKGLKRADPTKIVKTAAIQQRNDNTDAAAATEKEENRVINENKENTAKRDVIKSYSLIGEREIDAQLYSEAEQYLREKYESLLHEMELKRKQTQWRIRRLKSLSTSRKSLTQLYDRETSLWKSEYAKRLSFLPFKDENYVNPLIHAARILRENSEKNYVAAGDETRSVAAISDLTEEESVISALTAETNFDLLSSLSQVTSEERKEVIGQSTNYSTVIQKLPPIKEGENEELTVAPMPPIPLNNTTRYELENKEESDEFKLAEVTKNPDVYSHTNDSKAEEDSKMVEDFEAKGNVKLSSDIHEESSKDEAEEPLIESSFYDRLKFEFFNQAQLHNQVMNQEGLFQQLSNYLPLSLLLIGMNSNSLSWHQERSDKRSLVLASQVSAKTKSPVTRLPRVIQNFVSAKHEKMIAIRKYYQRLLMDCPNITKDIFLNSLTTGSIRDNVRPVLSIQYFQNLSYYSSMSHLDQQLNQRLFQKVFYELNFLQSISIFQQFFLISSKHQFLMDMIASIMEEYYDDYVIGFYDALALSTSSSLSTSKESGVSSFQMTPWLYHPLPAHYFQQKRIIKVKKLTPETGINNKEEFVTLPSLSPIWTTHNLYHTVDKLLKLNLYPAEMTKYRKYIQYTIPSTPSPNKSKPDTSTPLKYHKEMTDSTFWVWKQYLSNEALTSLQLQFHLPYPLNCFFQSSSSFLTRVSMFTQRYMEVYQLNKGYQLLWNELKEWKQYSSGRAGIPSKNSASELLHVFPVEEKQKYSNHQYYRMIHVYYFSLGSVLQCYHQYMNNRMMMANYHLYDEFQKFYVSFLSKQSFTSSSSSYSHHDSSFSNQISNIIEILDAYSIELAESSLLFERTIPKGEPHRDGDDGILKFDELQDLIENNIYRINTISRIKYYITACLEECRNCLAYFFVLVFTEKAKQRQDKMLVVNDLYQTFYDSYEQLNEKKGKVETAKGEKNPNERIDGKGTSVLFGEASDKDIKKGITKIKFHLMKITEYQRLIAEYGKTLYHRQTTQYSSSISPENNGNNQEYQYKAHIQTLLMYLSPQGSA